MTSRRDFLKKSGLAMAGLSLLNRSPLHSALGAAAQTAGDLMSKRPPLDKRKFVSEAVDEEIRRVQGDIGSRDLAWIFGNCYPNTLDTTVQFAMIDGRPDTFVITGDIDAMWLRDSSAQVWPYLPLVTQDPKLKELIAGVINRQTKCILLDPYANAFNYGPTGSPFDKDLTTMKPGIHERKWEVDSLCYPIRLAHRYWKETGDTSPFDGKWRDAMKLVVKTFRQQQRKDGRGPYKFQRVTAVQTDTVAGGGYGNPIKPVGMIVSIFRPSDDSTIFPFLVPSNLFAVHVLKLLAEMSRDIMKDEKFAGDCSSLADEVYEAVQRFAVVNHETFGDMYAYEVDGYGDHSFMDDANAPSLLSLPYLDCVPESDQVYQNTRQFLFSGSNPYYFKGAAGDGIGSAHTGLGKIWPIAIMMRAFTSRNDNEISRCLSTLVESSAGTGFMHESFDENDPKKFTRSWFAWANTLFGELIIRLQKEKPYLLS